ncbi:nitroreductase family deazaflavin-dependent oxidoreductase [Dactylosporangium aurantiacum]|nr:nitroreductase family deazaflavin-dependent oxidoreductase [Dactylosporangium aurantiacum]MDG6110483.1 nitroreductase family deazaflavin-dependent oxidoreductase [Dactylosporangium aurantiacum]
MYRHGLGWLLGPRLAMIEHRGRRSGQPRHVVLEVLERDAGTLVVVSGYGRTSQWFRNIEVHPDVRIWTGRWRGVPGRAEILSAGDSHDQLERYRDRHPRAAANLGRSLAMPDLTNAGPLAPDVGLRLPVVRIRYPEEPP